MTTRDDASPPPQHPHVMTGAWLKANWPMLSTFSFVLLGLLTAYATIFIQAQVAAAPPSPTVTKLSLDVELVKNDATHNKATLARIENNVDELDDKLTRLTEALMQRAAKE